MTIFTFGSEQYKQVELLGKGAYGTVYLLKHTKTHKPYIVKRIEYNDNEFTHDILKEIDTLRRFGDHPGIVSMVGLKVTNTCINILQPYMGNTLRHFIRSTTNEYRLQNADLIISQLLSSLHHLHVGDLIHRDLKPDNILISLNENGNEIKVTLCDFGLSKVLAVRHNTPKVCSLHYRCPELLFKKTEYTAAIDVWALGCILYEYFTGTGLFKAQNKKELIRMITDYFGITWEDCQAFGIEYSPQTMQAQPTQKWALFKDVPKPYQQTILNTMLCVNPIKRHTITKIATTLSYTLNQVEKTDKSNDKNDYISKADNVEIVRDLRHQLFNQIWHYGTDSNFDKQTLYLTYDLFDRYMSADAPATHVMLTHDNIQYIGFTCLHIASKFLEIIPFNPVRMGYCKKTVQQIKKLEKDILEKLDWVIYTPSYYNILIKLMPKDSDRCHKLAKYMYNSYDISSQSTVQVINTLKCIVNSVNSVNSVF